MPSSDHIVSFTLSAALHALGLLLIGQQLLRPHTELPDTEPELEITSVEIALTDTGPDKPGAEQAATPAPPQPAPLPPEPEPLPPPLPDAVPEPMPEPVVEPEPQPEPPPPPPPEPEPVPTPKPEPPPEPPKPQPAPEPPKPKPAEPAPAAPATPAAAPAAAPAAPAASVERGGGASGHIDAHPALERPIRPVYPIGARRRGEEGTVILDVTVSPSGRATRVSVVSGSGFPELDAAAERAAAQARFKPGKRDGRPVESAARITLIFRLRG